MTYSHKLFALSAALTFSATLAFADDPPTPTASPTATATAAATATPSACQSRQSCVNAAVPTAVASCVADTPICSDTNSDKLAVTAGELARRAIDKKKCTNRNNKFRCNVCYQNAKLPLQLRFKYDLFHGLLANSVKLIEAERKSVCGAL